MWTALCCAASPGRPTTALPQNSVHAILQTPRRFFVDRNRGAALRDSMGLNFRVFQQASEPARLPAMTFAALQRTHENALWIGTGRWLLLRESDGRFERFEAKNGLPSATILDVAADADGSVLVLTAKGVARVTTFRAPASRRRLFRCRVFRAAIRRWLSADRTMGVAGSPPRMFFFSIRTANCIGK